MAVFGIGLMAEIGSIHYTAHKSKLVASGKVPNAKKIDDLIKN